VRSVSPLAGVLLFCVAAFVVCSLAAGTLVLPELFAWRFAKNPPDPGVYLLDVDAVSPLAGVLFCVAALVASSLAAGTLVLAELFDRRFAKKPPDPGVYLLGAGCDVSTLAGVLLLCAAAFVVSALAAGAPVLPELFDRRFAKNPPDPGVYLLPGSVAEVAPATLVLGWFDAAGAVEDTDVVLISSSARPKAARN